MVRVTIYMEGGTKADTDAGKTVGASAAMREGFSKLLHKVLPETAYDLVIKPSGGYRETTILFKNTLGERPDQALLIDLDGAEATRNERIAKLDLSTWADQVFFMVQEMEAWFLSQPAIIDQYGIDQNFTIKKEASVAKHTLLKGKIVQEIEKPSQKLDRIFKEHFAIEKQKGGKTKKRPRSYDKGKDTTDLLAGLDLEQLRQTFTDVNRLILYIQQNNTIQPN